MNVKRIPEMKQDWLIPRALSFEGQDRSDIGMDPDVEGVVFRRMFADVSETC